MEGYINEKKLMLQINSLAIANSFYLYLIYIDAFMMDLKIQWFILGCDMFFLIGIYGSQTLANMSVLVVFCRYLLVMIWGTCTIKTVDLEKNPEYEVAINMVCYLLIDSLMIFPLNGIRFYFASKRQDEVEEQQDALEMSVMEGFDEDKLRAEKAAEEQKEGGGNEKEGIFTADEGAEQEYPEPKQVDVSMSIYSLTFASMIEKATVKYDLAEHVEDYFFKATMIFFI